MFRLIIRILTTATVVVAAGVPAVASARFEFNPPRPAVSSGHAQRPVVPSVQRPAASSTQGFHWDDAGIGAVGVLVLVGLGSGAVVARRRRTQQALTS
jgi:hypothetical protein